MIDISNTISIGSRDKGINWSSYWSTRWYGVEIVKANTSPDLSRVAGVNGMQNHALLPIHNEIYTAVVRDDVTEAYKLDPVDWSKQVGGAESKLDGTDGQVMTWLPRAYLTFDTTTNDIIKLSSDPISVDSVGVGGFYISSYEPTVQRSTNKLSSVKTMAADYRGGNNNATLDGTDSTQLGKPATAISLINFNTYAKNRGPKWEELSYFDDMYLKILIMIEFATRNFQKAVNAALTAEGYRQGGLGNGVTTLNGMDWNTFNGYYPVIPCGASDALASGTGEVDYIIPGFPGLTGTQKVNRWRGIEIPNYGHLWKWLSRANVYHQSVAEGGKSQLWVSDDPAIYTPDTSTGYKLAGNIPDAEGYVKEMTLTKNGLLYPSSVGDASNTYWCDYHYRPGLLGAWRSVLVGGHAYSDADAGPWYLRSDTAASSSRSHFGARLCCRP